MRFEVTTKASPGQVLDAFTDFSDRRLETWKRTPKLYDWSDPTVVRWTVVESSYGGGGASEIRLVPRDGGTRLYVEYDNTDPRPAQKPLMFLLHRGPMGRMIARMWTSTLHRYAGSADR
ncbi:SRPBCC family protein [Nocardioides sediminis]|uniref:hypothetical protein n=1 Tax=Nocardioides sediminis TaxID=433648 RepID=UPI000D306202|nr:hypothetical protein [Nocardioides sediminis]